MRKLYDAWARGDPSQAFDYLDPPRGSDRSRDTERIGFPL